MTSTVDADAGADASVTWSSSNVAVATVSGTGLVTALQPGSTSIRATSVLVPAVQGSTTLTVTAPPAFTTWTQAATSVQTTAIASGVELVTLANGTAWGIASGGTPGELRMLYFDGTSWSAPAASPFHAIRAIASFENSAWIGSFNGLFARLEQTVAGTPVWTSMSTPTNLNIIEMVGVSPSEAVALTLNRTLVLTGGVWTLLPASPLSGHYTMAASALDNIYTVQNNPVSGSRMRRWNGTAWTIVPDPPITGAAFTMLALTNTLLLSTTSSENFRLQNGSWTPLAVPSSGAGITNESIYSMTSCGGERYAGTTGGRVYRLDGDTWTVIATYGQAAIASGVVRVHCSPSGVLRAMGNSGSIGRYTGSNWIPEHLGGQTSAVRVLRPDLAYLAFGTAGIMRWDGAVWRVEMSDGVGTVSGQQSLTGLTVATDGTAMAVGGGGIKTGVWVRSGNGTWDFTAFTTNTVCFSVWAASSSFALAIGDTCSWRYDGANWLVQSAPLGGTRRWNAIDGFSPTFAFAAGSELNQSSIARWDGTQWNPVTVPNIGELREIDVVSPTLAWARSDNALIRWNGTDWQIVTGPTLSGSQLPIAGLSVHNASEVYLLSQNYGLYRFDGTTWTLITTVSAANNDAARAGAQALSTIPGFGIIGTGTPAPFHSTVNSGLKK